MSDGSSIDGEILDEIEDIFRNRYQQRRDGDLESAAEQSITADELGGRVGIDDGEGSPKTREAIKELKRERGIPAVGGNNGFRIPTDPQAIEDYCDTLESRIQGIKENKRLMEENWESWNHREAATDGGTGEVVETYSPHGDKDDEDDDEGHDDAVDKTDIRHAIRDDVREHDSPSRADVLERVSEELEVEVDEVVEEFERLKREGFVYVVDVDGEPEVRLP